MGIFDPPRVNFRKKIPDSQRFLFITMETAAEAMLFDWSSQRREFALAFIMSVWVFHACDQGILQLSDWDRRFIVNTGRTAGNSLSEFELARVKQIIAELMMDDNGDLDLAHS